MSTLLKRITAAVRELNANYGRGDVRKVKLFADGRIEVLRVPYRCAPETRHGKLVNGKTVHFAGHQITLR